MTSFAWVFMIVSMISVTGLVVWCYLRILTSEREFGTGSPDRPASQAEL